MLLEIACALFGVLFAAVFAIQIFILRRLKKVEHVLIFTCDWVDSAYPASKYIASLSTRSLNNIFKVQKGGTKQPDPQRDN
jgi:hypothetical protein